VKWNNWTEKKGMKPEVAKQKWLKMVEPLILKKGLPKCNY
jgi:acyl-CoA-binding protein